MKIESNDSNDSKKYCILAQPSHISHISQIEYSNINYCEVCEIRENCRVTYQEIISIICCRNFSIASTLKEPHVDILWTKVFTPDFRPNLLLGLRSPRFGELFGLLEDAL